MTSSEGPRHGEADPFIDRSDRRDDPKWWSSESELGAVATAHYLATRAGSDVLRAGGNAIDAAVAASLALAVVEPAGSGLGGMGMMLVHDATKRETLALPGSCLAPRLATPEAIRGLHRYRGYGAVAVPTLPAVLAAALERWGTWTVSRVMEPAIELAKNGFRVTPVQNATLSSYAKALNGHNGADVMLDPSGRIPDVGALWRQPALADTLAQLSEAGLRDFYEGEIAAEIVRDMRDNGGFIREDDLASVEFGQPAQPLSLWFGDSDVRTVGPPAGGLWFAEMLRLAETIEGGDIDLDSPAGLTTAAAIIQRVRQDRRRLNLETGTNSPGSAIRVLSTEYLEAVTAEIETLRKDRSSDARTPGQAGTGETSHLSVMDAQGNAVALTQSIERSFGSACASPRLGFLYNGFLRAFKAKNPEHPYFLRPGAVARSNAAPTILLQGGKPTVVLGSTGSERAASSMFCVLLRLARNTPFEAVAAPRLHCTPEGVVLIEAPRMEQRVLDALEAWGFTLEPLDAYAFNTGGLQLTARSGRSFIAVADPRRDGGAGPEK